MAAATCKQAINGSIMVPGPDLVGEAEASRKRRHGYLVVIASIANDPESTIGAGDVNEFTAFITARRSPEPGTVVKEVPYRCQYLLRFGVSLNVDLQRTRPLMTPVPTREKYTPLLLHDRLEKVERDGFHDLHLDRLRRSFRLCDIQMLVQASPTWCTRRQDRRRQESCRQGREASRDSVFQYEPPAVGSHAEARRYLQLKRRTGQ